MLVFEKQKIIEVQKGILSLAFIFQLPLGAMREKRGCVVETVGSQYDMDFPKQINRKATQNPSKVVQENVEHSLEVRVEV